MLATTVASALPLASRGQSPLASGLAQMALPFPSTTGTCDKGVPLAAGITRSTVYSASSARTGFWLKTLKMSMNTSPENWPGQTRQAVAEPMDHDHQRGRALHLRRDHDRVIVDRDLPAERLRRQSVHTVALRTPRPAHPATTARATLVAPSGRASSLGRARSQITTAGSNWVEPFCPPQGIIDRLTTAFRPNLQLVHSTAKPLASAPLDFDSLFERYAGYVARVAARMLGRDDADVDGVVQEVFFTTLPRLDRIHSEEAARPWLMVVTVRTVHRVLRRRKWRRLFLGESSAAEIPATGVTPEQSALLARIYRTLDEIESKNRIAWILRYVEGERLEDVADACRCSLATAKRRIATAQKILMECEQPLAAEVRRIVG